MPERACAIVPIGPGGPDHYFDDVARLHETELQAGLMAKLGVAFLADFYRYVAGDPDCVLLAAVDGDRVIGFVSGTRDIGKFYRRFVARRGLALGVRLVPHLLRWRSLSSLVSLRRYLIGRDTRLLPVSELTSLAVGAAAQRRGVGRALFAALQDRFRREGIRAFQVTAAETQLAALRFYPAVGARAVARTRLGDLDSFVFVCPVPSDAPGC
jgi:ribosomal protein S18 acetylase RimI-like enzyme